MTDQPEATPAEVTAADRWDDIDKSMCETFSDELWPGVVRSDVGDMVEAAIQSAEAAAYERGRREAADEVQNRCLACRRGEKTHQCSRRSIADEIRATPQQEGEG